MTRRGAAAVAAGSGSATPADANLADMQQVMNWILASTPREGGEPTPAAAGAAAAAAGGQVSTTRSKRSVPASPFSFGKQGTPLAASPMALQQLLMGDNGLGAVATPLEMGAEAGQKVLLQKLMHLRSNPATPLKGVANGGAGVPGASPLSGAGRRSPRLATIKTRAADGGAEGGDVNTAQTPSFTQNELQMLLAALGGTGDKSAKVAPTPGAGGSGGQGTSRAAAAVHAADAQPFSPRRSPRVRP